MALIIALTFAVMVLGLVYSGTMSLSHTRRSTEVNLQVRGQARVVAESGIIDCLDWLRRQSTQPVKVFNPKLDLLANPMIQDTDDPTIGIVRSFEISKGVWGRYEVRKFVPNLPGNVAEMRDISLHRGATSAGAVWRIVSRSYVYRRANPLLPFNQLPNHVLGQMVLETEARRLVFSPPAEAAISASQGKKITISVFGRVDGGTGGGIAYPSGTGKPGGAGKILGTPSEAILTTWDDSTEGVFGVSEDVLRAMSTLIVTDMTKFPSPVPQNQLLFADTNLYFTNALPLKGTGILYIKGDLTIAPGSNSLFNGIIYVTGDIVIKAPSTINGTVIALGNMNLIGSGDWAEIIYDSDVINALMIDFGQYRKSTVLYEHDLNGTLKR